MHRSAGNDVARPQTTLCTPGVSRATTPSTAVARPPVETPVPREYPTGLRALLPWLVKPVRTPVAIFGSLGVCIYVPASRHWLISYSPIHLA